MDTRPEQEEGEGAVSEAEPVSARSGITLSPNHLAGVVLAAGVVGFGVTSYVGPGVFPLDGGGDSVRGDLRARVERLERDQQAFFDDLRAERRLREQATADRITRTDAEDAHSLIRQRIENNASRTQVHEERLDRQSSRIEDLRDRIELIEDAQ